MLNSAPLQRQPALAELLLLGVAAELLLLGGGASSEAMDCQSADYEMADWHWQLRSAW